MLGRRWALDLMTGVLLRRGGRRTDTHRGKTTREDGARDAAMRPRVHKGQDGRPPPGLGEDSLPRLLQGKPALPTGGLPAPGTAREGDAAPGNRSESRQLQGCWGPLKYRMAPGPAPVTMLPLLASHAFLHSQDIWEAGTPRRREPRIPALPTGQTQGGPSAYEAPEAPGTVLGAVTVSLKPNRKELGGRARPASAHAALRPGLPAWASATGPPSPPLGHGTPSRLPRAPQLWTPGRRAMASAL